ncbi:xanthine dehydrogenase family protein molybdopterin-binding subunit [Roseibium limicola]|uniref:Xanthine dehydrogenase family protein molybdopterin-binding subunit n=1 Tax=Roseibium limicola TaxID=2816037 RepID=A0A939EKJ3_9HYPH|nr:xanthine dehydrogenase family protein molybdopterin-binding subunit [Roseibium limicola]MBO0344097.1 xanthine dehydrogenase family protein molybdopterin-binding subunit [Roseibium limicola]
MTLTTSRRNFLIGAGASATALVIGLKASGALAATPEAAAAAETSFTPFVRISAEGKITAVIKHFEMGQGTTTGLTSLIAEELNADLQDVDVAFAPSNNDLYKNLAMGMQGTGGSTAMANSYQQYRRAGAAAREMLIAAAAEKWNVSAADLTLSDGVISGAGKSAPIADFVTAAAEMPVPAEPKLKDPSDFRIIGKTGIRRRDTSGKINGTAQFGMDLHLPGQIIVAVLHAPRTGAKVASFDASGAEEVAGFIEAKAKQDNSGVFVYATDTWSAFQAREALSVEWNFDAAESRGTDDIRAEMMTMVNSDPEFTVKADLSQQEAADALASADQVIEAEFWFPNLAHAAMEPLNCTISPREDGGIILHDGCQFPALVHPTIAGVLNLDPSKVEIRTLLAGGSFGRRANAESDYNVEAALAYALTDRTKPVKMVWSREDDVRGGYYRPAFAHKVRVGLDASGTIVAWDHRIAGQSIAKGTMFENFMVHEGVDHTSVEGIPDTPYAIPGLHVGLTDSKPLSKVLWWRSVGNTHTAYVMETMLDMVAKAAGQDPVDYRLKLLAGGTADQNRLAGVLREVADKSGWSNKAPEGHARGVAVHKSFGSYVAEIVEVSGTVEDGVKIEKVTCAVDCGIVINPDVVIAQMEGGIGYGIGHVMRNAITFDGGEVVQSNFYDYEPLRMPDIAAIDVHIVASTDEPTGVGEPGVPPSGPALANAIAGLGKRVTHLPMVENGVTFL